MLGGEELRSLVKGMGMDEEDEESKGEVQGEHGMNIVERGV